MTGGNAYRGQPLVALLLILGGWIAIRTMVYDAGLVAARPIVPQRLIARAVAPPQTAPAKIAPADAVTLGSGPPVSVAQLAPPTVRPRRTLAPAWSVTPVASPWPAQGGARADQVPARAAAGHQLMFLSAMSQVPLPPVIFVPPAAPGAPGRDATDPPRFTVRSRWSADGWLLLRGGRSRLVEGAPLASYGASQVGAVLRYRLAPGSAHRPDAYVRASSALSQRDRELAAGLAARPIARVPVVVAAELRLSDQGGAVRSRPAAFAYTELPPSDLPLGLRGEAYAQAGYVGGRFATAFADAQARVDRAVAEVGPARLRMGAGAWGGAQKGASRIDIGPAASLGIDAGRGAARLELDWRFRVAGSAAPASGPALTLSAGF